MFFSCNLNLISFKTKALLVNGSGIHSGGSNYLSCTICERDRGCCVCVSALLPSSRSLFPHIEDTFLYRKQLKKLGLQFIQG